ncbi:hypothetical protein LDENG_00267480 [Lucifuga dentata]|nr:hypothetical protein LDENG_00267480 [Lucifuga dentata]
MAIGSSSSRHHRTAMSLLATFLEIPLVYLDRRSSGAWKSDLCTHSRNQSRISKTDGKKRSDLEGGDHRFPAKHLIDRKRNGEKRTLMRVCVSDSVERPIGKSTLGCQPANGHEKGRFVKAQQEKQKEYKSPLRRDMNLNDFVVLPNKKAKSVKLSARNLQELKFETVSLAQESKEMEEKLQQLKESMSKEKEERGSGAFRWKSGQCSTVNSNVLPNKNKENRLQKQLSAGKVKIRVLKDESLTAPSQPPLPPAAIRLLTRKHRQRGTTCGQCEVKTAGLKCAECAENYCIGCFAKFHQKGALKLHRMIPIQTDIQTHVSTRDVVNQQTQVNPSSNPTTFTNPHPSSKFKPSPNLRFTSNAILNQISKSKSMSQAEQSPEKGTEAGPKDLQLQDEQSQVLVVNHEEEQDVEVTEEEEKMKHKGFPTSLIKGEPDEKEPAISFNETPTQRTGGRNEGGGGGVQMRGHTDWKLARPVSVLAMATQADLPRERGAEGRRHEGEERRTPVRVEFSENSLTYLDRLLLKKHRRTPIETYQPSPAFCPALTSPSYRCTKEETVSGLTAQEEDLHHYCASLFAVPASRCRTESQIATYASSLIIEVLDETDTDLNADFVAEKRTDDIKSPDPPSTQSNAPTEPRKTQVLNSSKPQTQLTKHSTVASSKSFMSSSPLPTDYESTLSHEDLHCNLSDPSPLLISTQNPLSAVRMDKGISIDSDDEMSTDSLGLTLREEDSSDDEEVMTHECFERCRSRDKNAKENPAVHLLGDSFVLAEPDREKDLQTDEPELSMMVLNQKAESRSQHFCDLGLDFSSGRTSQPEFIDADSSHICQNTQLDSDPTGSASRQPGSSLRTDAEEHLIFRAMMSDHIQPAGIQSHATTSSSNGIELRPLFRPLSQAAQEIMDICGVDQSGCEDPDLDTDANVHTLSCLERELRLLAKETQTLVVATGNSGSEDQQRFKGGRVSEEQREEEEAAQRDRHSVLLLP